MKSVKKLTFSLLILCTLISWCTTFTNKKNDNLTKSTMTNQTKENAENNLNPKNNIEILTEQNQNIQRDESVEYENKKNSFKLKIPNNRTFQENNQWFDLILYTPKNDNINENLWIKVQELQTKETPESFIDKTVEWLQNLYETYNEIDKKNIEINWLEGISLIYEMMENWHNLKAQQTVFLKDNKTYVLQYTATKDTFNNYINEINNIINSFNVLN